MRENDVWNIASMQLQQFMGLSYEENNSEECALTSTIALGKSSALNSCSIASIMFFQPSRNISPWRWARLKTVFAATWAFPLLPNTVGRFSTDWTHKTAFVTPQGRLYI